ncbi:MAG: ABC transporter permease [Eubacterium sp.]
MKKYLSFFRLRFTMGLQYRAAAWAGVVTQFFWGAMEIMVFCAFYRADASSFPMSLQETVSYVWLQQAFLALFAAWMVDNEVFESIMSGDIAYELCRPISIYNMWFSRGAALRTSRAILRCFPILIVAALLPKPYGICAPESVMALLCFVAALIIGLFVMVAFFNMVYGLTFFMVSPRGIRILVMSGLEFFTGAVIPLPFFPDKMARIMELLPFASMQNVPLRIYSGNIQGKEMVYAVLLQIIWLIILIVVGKALCHIAEKKVCIQGG